MRILVTGANGFLGRHVVPELVRRGHAVRAMVRASARTEHLGWPSDVEIVRADLRGHRDWGGIFQDVDCVVHLAALVVGDDDAQFAATVVGTERFLAGMAAAPHVRRLVFCSSFSVYDWSAIRGELNESSPLEEAELYERDGYAVAKAWQERVVRRASAANKWDLTVLRPGFIWGTGNEYLSGIGQSIGKLHLLVGGRRRMPLTHVENCAHCFAAAVDEPSSIGETFNVVDGHRIGVWGYMGRYMRRRRVRGVRVVLPYTLAYAVTRLAQFTSRRIFRGKGKLPSILVPCKFEARFKPLRFSNRKLRDVLGWQPPLSFEQCLERTYGTSKPAASTAPAAIEPADPLAIDTGQAVRA